MIPTPSIPLERCACCCLDFLLLGPVENHLITRSPYILGYGELGERLVAGVVPLSTDKTQVLLIQSTRRGGWVLPKGGWETDEDTPQEAAIREAWEEAGVICSIQGDLGKISEMRSSSQLSAVAPKALYQFYEVSVDKEEDDWPEKYKRGRAWMRYQDAKEALASRPELMEALDRSSIER